jgi:hypothetical protein
MTRTRRTATRRATPKRRVVKKRVVKKRVAKKPVVKKRVVKKRVAKKRVARKRTAAKRSAPPPAFPQTQGASERDRILFRMVRARAAVVAAVQGMGAATAEIPFGPGKWNTRETILHLVTRDRARLREMEAALRGVQPSWNGLDPEKQAAVNEQDLVPLRHLSWEDALRLLLTTREQLIEALESIPGTPEEVWKEEHPLGWMFQRLPNHDLHHADIIKHWRVGQSR